MVGSSGSEMNHPVGEGLSLGAGHLSCAVSNRVPSLNKQLVLLQGMLDCQTDDCKAGGHTVRRPSIHMKELLVRLFSNRLGDDNHPAKEVIILWTGLPIVLQDCSGQ